MLDKQIAERCKTTILWYSCTGIAANLEKSFSETAVEVPCYQWYSSEQVFGPAGITYRTVNNLYLDLEVYPIQQGDKIIWEEQEFEIKVIKSYFHPVYNNQKIGVIQI